MDNNEWKCVEDSSYEVKVFMATPKEGSFEHIGMMQAIGEHIDSIGQCITLTRTWFRYKGGTEPGIEIGIRNYPRFPWEDTDLMRFAENLGRIAAEAGGQKTFMIQDADSVYWFTRNPEHHKEGHDWHG